MQAEIDKIFDQIYVISLTRSFDRRAYISKHFNDLNITKYTFFDAIDATSKEVEECFLSGQVAMFPPCFRCQGLACGDPDCNNALIPAQVANFLTHKSLWGLIASKPQRALVVEDDVVFEPSALQTFIDLQKAVANNELVFEAEVPMLLRLGWAKGEDHFGDKTFRLEAVLRMSNPCYGITSGLASEIMRRFTSINTTSDIFLHEHAPLLGESYTVFPPLASELSWSTGSFQSLIHPKITRSDYLRNEGLEPEAIANDKIVSEHIKHMYHRKFLLVGHPRCGTGFSANILNQLGFEIGHETNGKDGISSWMFAVESIAPYFQSPEARTRKALVWDTLIQPVRDLVTAVPSVMLDNIYAPPSFEFRRQSLMATTGIDLASFQTNFERAVLSVVLWSELIQALKPDITFRIEDGVPMLIDDLKKRGFDIDIALDALDLSPVNANKLYQAKSYQKPSSNELDWRSLDSATTARVEAYCEQYGYDLPRGWQR